MDIGGIASFAAGFVVMAGIYSVFALGLNVHWGFTGLFNIGIAGFFAVGAYTSAILTTQPPDPALFEEFTFGGNLAEVGFLDLGVDLWFGLGLAAAGAVCGAIALVIGYVTLRLRDDYLAIATFLLRVQAHVKYGFITTVARRRGVAAERNPSHGNPACQPL